MNNYNALKKYKWKGSFTVPNTKFTFSAALSCDLKEGIVLDAMILDSGKKFRNYILQNEIRLFHGILDNSYECTLFGFFKPIKQLEYGQNDVINLTFRVDRVLIGKHANNESKFKFSIFTISGLSEFYSVRDIPYVQTVENSEYSINIFDQCLIRNCDLSDVLIDGSGCREVLDCIKNIDLDELPLNNQYITYKDDKSKAIKLKYNSNVCIDKITNDILQLSHLIAFLTNNPQLPVRISVYEEGYENECYLLLSHILRDETVEHIKKFSRALIDVNAGNVDFPNVSLNWLTRRYNVNVLSTMVQHRGEWVNIRDIYGDYILLCAQFESISNEYNKKKDSKFLFPIEKFGSELINEKLKQFFLKRFNSDPGRSISGIRADITHPKGEENEFLSKIHISEINGLSIIMFSIVISKVLIDSGVDSSVTDSYQYRLGVQHLSQ